MKLIAAPLALAAALDTAQAQPVASTPPSVAPPAMRATAPGMAAYTDEVLFGEVWKRPGLSQRDRSLVTVSALVATGRTQQLTGHAGRALDNGVTPVEIAGIITHLAFYAGWPPAVSSIGVVDEVFKARGIDRAVLHRTGAPLPVPPSEPARAALVDRTVGTVVPSLADLTNRVLFADLWRRSDLAPRDRSLATIAALIAMGDADQLPFHIGRGLENGLTRDQLGEAITHLAFYAGWPKAMAAVPMLAKAAAEATPGPAPNPAGAAPLTITRRGAQARQGPAATFTGRVTVDTPFSGTDGANVGGAIVRFEAGARTAWHSHPLGQTLVVTEGHAWVQREGGRVEEAGPGDVVWIPPNVKHWHGATPLEGMTHIAISERQNGQTVTWMEQLSDADYAGIRRIHE